MSIDTVVFDVDGVLVDTDASYIEAVLRTVQWLLVRDAGLIDDGPAVGRADVRAFKLAGGWNNDWDLSTGLYRWLLSPTAVISAGASSNPGGAARSVGALLAASTTAARRAAGSAADAARLSLDEHGRRAGARAPRTWKEVRGIFDEFYGGTATAVARYGLVPRVHNARGLCLHEVVVLTPALVEALCALGVTRFGVVTGRSQAEWEAVAPQVPLPPETVVSTEAHGKKPDPAPLRRVVDALDARSFVYVGDTMDDLRTVQAYARSVDARPGIPVVLCPVEEEPPYRAAGASVFVRDIVGLPAVVAALL